MQWRAWKRPVRGLFLAGLVGLTVALASCGTKGRLPVYPVKGKVLVDGKPAKDAFVNFFPKDTGGREPYAPYAQTNENGEFTLSTYETGDGVPAGEYDVTITWPVRYNPISTLWEGDRLKGRYADRNKPPFHVTIDKKAQELPPFELKSSGPGK
ncbi:MAG TPA: hypothetical protein VNK04_22380 [Gemmataceae bacterium]|nr:hypothetical protein [Gemmataceae bacterium]